MPSTIPFPDDDVQPTRRQLAIAALIQHIWDRTTQAAWRSKDDAAHPNWGVPQSQLSPVDRWANAFTAVVLDRWVNAYAGRQQGGTAPKVDPPGERRAANVLFMLWSIARFGPKASRGGDRRRPATLRDIPRRDLALMTKWWDLSLDPSRAIAADRELGRKFAPTYHQMLLDRCIVRAAIACQGLTDDELVSIADEHELDSWADRLAGVDSASKVLRRQRDAISAPTILITGPTSTGKSSVAWALAREMSGIVIAADSFQICAIPPLGLGVGLPHDFPPAGVRAALYRSKAPGANRPSPDTVADWVSEITSRAEFRGVPKIVEGGSVSTSASLWKRDVPTHAIVFQADPQAADANIRLRMSAEKMNLANMLAEAEAVRACGYEPTWVVRESIIYPTLLRILDGRIGRREGMARIRQDWVRLVADQQEWFDELRNDLGVVTLSQPRQSVAGIRQLLDC